MEKENLKLAIKSIMESYIHSELQPSEKHMIGDRYEIKGFENATDRIMQFLEESGHLIPTEEYLEPHERP